VEKKKADRILKSANDNALLIKAFKPSIKITVIKIQKSVIKISFIIHNKIFPSPKIQSVIS